MSKNIIHLEYIVTFQKTTIFATMGVNLSDPNEPFNDILKRMFEHLNIVSNEEISLSSDAIGRFINTNIGFIYIERTNKRINLYNAERIWKILEL